MQQNSKFFLPRLIHVKFYPEIFFQSMKTVLQWFGPFIEYAMAKSFSLSEKYVIHEKTFIRFKNNRTRSKANKRQIEIKKSSLK